MFHVFFFKSIDFTTLIQITFYYESQKKNEFEIEKILKQQNQNYFIK